METINNAEGGNKVFLAILVIFSVLILLLLVLVLVELQSIKTKGPEATGAETTGVEKAGVTKMGNSGLCKKILEKDGELVVEKVENCCGNGVCEEGEGISNCPIDCTGEIKQEVDKGGGTYWEYIVEKVVCEPNSGVSDGALCDCTEINCNDQVDNDKDGLVDCYDPDCNCIPCPPCNCTNQTTSCEESEYPTCGGSCPDGYTCEAATTSATTALNGYCRCVPETVKCEDSYNLKCTGECPEGEVCQMVGDGCECVKQTTSCEESEYPTCGGSCPEGYTCEGAVSGPTTALNGYCRCVPETVKCEDSYDMQCTGECPEGEYCVSTTWGTCKCQKQTCEESEYPICGGSCPKGQMCTTTDEQTCECVPEIPRCEDSYNLKCTGECPEGEVCQMVGDGCECVTQYTCSGMDANSCEQGTCPPGEVCQYTAGECSCVEETGERCGDSEPPMCEGSCDTETGYCTERGDTCVCAVSDKLCADGEDNDNDGLIDCQDPDCANSEYC